MNGAANFFHLNNNDDTANSDITRNLDIFRPFSHSMRVTNSHQHENNLQFPTFSSHQLDENKDLPIRIRSTNMALSIFQDTDKSLFTRDTSLRDIIKYYKDLISAKYPNIIEYDFNIILKIVLVYLNITYDDNLLKVELSENKIYRQNGCTIVGEGYLIVRKPAQGCVIYNTPNEGRKIVELSQNERIWLASSAKSYAKIVQNKQKRSETHHKRDQPVFNFEEISLRDKKGRFSTKTQIVFDEPELGELEDSIDINSQIIRPLQSVGENGQNTENLELDNEDAGEVIIRDRVPASGNIAEMLEVGELIHYDMLYHTTNNPKKTLYWDGTYLGDFGKKDYKIIKTQITLGNKYMLLEIKGEQFWSEYIKLKDNENIYLIGAIDEWKPLFGIEKIGSHSITLDGKNFMLFKTPDSSTTFAVDKNLSDINPKKVKGDHLDQIRKILLFKYLIGCPLKLRNGGNYIRLNIASSRFSSHFDTNTRDSYGSLDLQKCIINRWLTDKLGDGDDQTDQYLKIFSRNLNSIIDIKTDEDKEFKPSILRSNMENIGRRINVHGESNYCITFIISRVQYLIDCC